MNASAVTDAVSATANSEALSSKHQLEVAAVLLQRLNHALDAGGKARDDISCRIAGQQGDARPRAPCEPDDTSMRVPNEHMFGALAHPVAPSATAAAADTTAKERATQPGLADELKTLLERLCSGVYVGDRSACQQRVLLTLDGVLHGAAAEIVREGAHLIIRLHAGNEMAYRNMLTWRTALERTLHEHGLPQVAIEIVPVGGLLHARRD